MFVFLILRDEYDSDSDSPTADEEERPLTQAELRERIMRGVRYMMLDNDNVILFIIIQM